MTTGRILSYGLLGLPLAFAALPIYVHVPRFYAEVAGMELALLGAILLATRLLERRMRRAGIAAACHGTGPAPLRPRAAAAALALWFVLRRLLEDAGGAAPRTLELSVSCAGRDDEIAIRIDGAALSAHTLDALEEPLAEAGARLERHGERLLVVLP